MTDKILAELDSIDKSSFHDEKSRAEALRSAQALVQRLEQPWESTIRVVWTQNVVLSAIRIAADIGLFSHLDTTPQTHVELAKRVNCEDVLLFRLLRQLAVGGVVEQQGENDAWIDTDWSRALKDPDGLINGINFFYDVEINELTNLPNYLRRTGYRNPTDNTHPPDRDWMGSDFWTYMSQHPDVQSSFHKWLGGLIPSVPWPSYYPLERIMEGVVLDPSKPLAVDVGGGHGNEMKALVAASATARQHDVVVQDVPNVVESLQLEAPIRALTHDFFKPQPEAMRGSRIYFMCSVPHDWPDKECRIIFKHIRDAMKPGYSKLLIRECILPPRAVNSGPLGSCLDMVMMAHFCSMERTQEQWRGLLESSGLTLVKVFLSPDGVSGVIEVERAED